jgi:shikimate dehydrogenase
MHNAAFAKLGLDIAYIPLHVRPSDVKLALDTLRAFDFVGANVTVPHKLAVMPFLDSISDLSRLIGAVNTIVNKDGKLSGTTTDPFGFLEGFREAGHSFTGKTVALIGSGGSARTLAFSLLLEDAPARVILAARDAEKAGALANEIKGKIGAKGKILETIALKDYARVRKEVQVIVNATSLGMQPHVDTTPLAAEDLEAGQVVYDIVYAPERTKLIRDAQARGLKTVGGLGMLVHQGRASFKLWTGVEPDAALFYQAAREQLAKRAAAAATAAGSTASGTTGPAARGISEEP